MNFLIKNMIFTVALIQITLKYSFTNVQKFKFLIHSTDKIKYHSQKRKEKNNL